MTSNHELVGRALGLLHQGLYPFVEREMRSVYGDRWIVEATPHVPRDPTLRRNVAAILQEDVSALLKVMNGRWSTVFKQTLGRTERSLVNELLDTRDKWAHTTNTNHRFSQPNTNRALDSMERLLRAIDAIEEADAIAKIRGYDEFPVPQPQPITPPPPSMRTIAIHATKGGVGKTTLVVNLAYELAKKGKRVLVVDLDDSANTSLLLGVNKADEIEQADNLEEIERILHSFDGRKELIDFLTESQKKDFDGESYIYPSILFNKYLKENRYQGKISIIPSSYRTKTQDIVAAPNAFNRLEVGLRTISDKYDFVIIDTPPSSDVISYNGLYAAQYWLIPSQMEYLSIYGILTPVRKAQAVQKKTNRERGNILGIVPMMTDAKLVLHKKIRKLVENTFPDIKVFSDVKRSTHVGMALSSRQPVSVYSKQNSQVPSEIGNMFSEITEELLKQIALIENNRTRKIR
jgi:chromosome partitioning protein